MSRHPAIIDVTAANFATEVLETSSRVPVLVDFWATWCGPCQTLIPVLERLAAEYHGEFVLAKVNIDEQQELATRYGIRSVPTVKLFRHGEVVDEFMGAQPETTIRGMIDNHIERESDKVIAAAREAMDAGRVDDAVASLRVVHSEEPGNSRAALALAEALIGAAAYTEAEEVIRGLPADVGAGEDAGHLMTRLEFARAVDGAPPVDDLERRLASNPSDGEARYQLAIRKVGAKDYPAALEQLLELLRTDRDRREQARTTMLKVFALVGEGDLVKRYRSRMASALL